MKKGKSHTVDEIYQKLAHYCAYQDRCHLEVEKKLNEFSLIAEAKDHIIIQLIQDNFLNEERFTQSFIQGKFNQKKWGKKKIINELKSRNIPQKLIEKGLNSIEDTDYLETLTHLLLKKRKEFKLPLSFESKTKINRYLLQKGYEYEWIKEAWHTLDP